MAYTGDSEIVGLGLSTAQQIDAFFKVVAAERSQGVTMPPAGLGQLFVTGCRRYNQIVNHDLAAAQSAHETAGWTSYWASKNNPAGIGVTGVPGAGEVFETAEDGIQAQVAHLLSYAAGVGPWVKDDPRADAMPRESFGAAPAIAGLNGLWAVPGPVYGQSIATLANRLVMMGAGPLAYEMPSSINGIPVRKSFIPITNINRPGSPANAEGRRWITVHETGNPSPGADAEMHRRFVHNGGGAVPPNNDGVSFTFVLDDHEIVWLLPLEEKSWQASDGANGTGNSSISIETCVNSDGNWNRTQENLAQLVAYLATHVPERSTERIAQHNKWARDGKNCPTRMRAAGENGWNKFLKRVNEIATGGSPPPDALILPGNPYGPVPIVAGFRAWCETQGKARCSQDVTAGILSIVGYPQGVERGTAFGSVQPFERCVLHWYRDTAPPWDIVLQLRD
jgi:hypothetical protein